MNKLDLMLQEWLNVAKWAPSGGNAQPWLIQYETIESNPNTVRLELSIDKDYKLIHSPLDAHGAAAWLSIGCLKLNLIEIAKEYLYEYTHEEIFFGTNYWTSKLSLFFKLNPGKSLQENSNYHRDDFLNRRTNRNRFSQKPIPQNDFEELKKICETTDSIHYKVFQNNEKKEFVANIIPLEKIRWSNLDYLKGLLFEIEYKYPNHPASQTKIPVDQLGLNTFDQFFFKKLNKSPWLQNILIKYLYPLILQKSLVGFSNHCDKIFILQARSNSAADILMLGYTFQNLWLQINKKGIGFQPLGTPLVALGYWTQIEQVKFTSEQAKSVENTTDLFLKKYNIDLKLPTMAFRLGYITKEHGQAPRKNIFIQKI